MDAEPRPAMDKETIKLHGIAFQRFFSVGEPAMSG